jgi:LPXTG-site transpeptidase (sortase) family protein
MMRSWFSHIDRSVALGAGVLVASLALLGIAVVSIFVALNNDGANLPNQGSIEQILNEGAAQNQAGAAARQVDLGPLPPPPVRLAIPRLYVDAPIVTMGLDADRYPQVPERPDQVAWYNFTASPGQRSNAVFAGHVDWQTSTRQPIAGVFYRLRELEIGDTVTVTLEDGQKLTYRVTGNVATAYEDPNVLKAMDYTAREVITMITCGGTWVKTGRGPFGGNYSHRVLVRAERVAAVAQAPANGSP